MSRRIPIVFLNRKPKIKWISHFLLLVALITAAISVIFPISFIVALSALGLAFLTRIIASPPTQKSRTFLYVAATVLALGMAAYFLSAAFIPGLGIGFFVGFALVAYFLATDFLKKPQSVSPALPVGLKLIYALSALAFIGLSAGFFLLAFSNLPLLLGLPLIFGVIGATIGVGTLSWCLTGLCTPSFIPGRIMAPAGPPSLGSSPTAVILGYQGEFEANPYSYPGVSRAAAKGRRNPSENLADKGHYLKVSATSPLPSEEAAFLQRSRTSRAFFAAGRSPLNKGGRPRSKTNVDSPSPHHLGWA